MDRRIRDRPARSGLIGALHLRFGQAAMLVSGLARPPLSLGVRLVATDEAGRVFLVRHSYVPGFYLPGGAVDPEESCAEAAAREAREEGALLLPTPPELFHIYWNPRGGKRDHIVLFVARGVRVEQAHRPTLEIREAGFHAMEALPEDVTPATRDRLAEVLEGKPVSDRW